MHDIEKLRERAAKNVSGFQFSIGCGFLLVVLGFVWLAVFKLNVIGISCFIVSALIGIWLVTDGFRKVAEAKRVLSEVERLPRG